ncbi:MAG TPA: DNA mismatch repair endonuclease MutL [Bacteroidales bacterium]|nr:DNA mismatch repair endonuclease MutL [Bacteroidales bacterium]
MSDIIKILPDNVANQIAAGEVIQRPASAVKELLENAIDAGADDIQLIIKDAGKTLIQVVDNGAGMSETDARLCFERHATSKINEAGDLFKISTFGFRGEALASIAAVAQVEMKTKRRTDDVATLIVIEGSNVKEHTSCSAADGTSLSVKNLFFNVPARRNFLKSDTTETTYIIEEFHRVALVYPEISFSFYNNGKLLTRLDKMPLRQRINSVFGQNYGEKLIALSEDTNVADIKGFIGKPEFARKTRGEQYFFVNKRFIKYPYLNHAVDKAYAELIPDQSYPSYFIYITIDPKNIDVNIHPAKTEVKFQDEKILYSILKGSIRKSFGSFNITPSIDFEAERALDFGDIGKPDVIKIPTVKINPDYNPFQSNRSGSPSGDFHKPVDKNLKNWETLYELGKEISAIQKDNDDDNNEEQKEIPLDFEQESFFCFGKKFIITPVKSGLMFIDIVNARERILYERFLQTAENQNPSCQRLLFPGTLLLNPADAELLADIMKDMSLLGFDIEAFGKNTFVVNGVPADLSDHDINETIERLLESYKKNQLEAHYEKSINLIRSLARNLAAKTPLHLSYEAMQMLVGELFACSMPPTSPSGKKVLFILSFEEIEKKFK